MLNSSMNFEGKPIRLHCAEGGELVDIFASRVRVVRHVVSCLIRARRTKAFSVSGSLRTAVRILFDWLVELQVLAIKFCAGASEESHGLVPGQVRSQSSGVKHSAVACRAIVFLQDHAATTCIFTSHLQVASETTPLPCIHVVAVWLRNVLQLPRLLDALTLLIGVEAFYSAEFVCVALEDNWCCHSINNRWCQAPQGEPSQTEPRRHHAE
mmetsp:Transcript_52497/g.94137  ORF Transcript_52497/g.94137 Transcript_52497/m.94137 type:complete len:211 (-) Transcript_52497:32-664(-)